MISTHEDIQFCAWIPDSGVIVCTDYQSNYILLIDIDTGQPIGKIRNPGKDFSSIIVSESGRLVFAGCVDGSIAVAEIPERWHRLQSETSDSENQDDAVEEISITESLQLDNETITGMVILDDVLFCSSASGRVSTIQIPSQLADKSPQVSNLDLCSSATISHNGEILIGQVSGTIVKIDAAFTRTSDSSRSSLSEAIQNGDAAPVIVDDSVVDEVAVSPNGRYLGWSNWTQQVQLHELSASRTISIAPQIEPFSGLIEVVVFSPDSQRIAWTGRHRTLSTATTTVSPSLQTVSITNSGEVLQFSPDSAQLAHGGRADQVTILSSDGLTTNRTLNDCSGCTAIKWHSSGQSLLLGFRTGAIQIRGLSANDSIKRSYVHRKEVRAITLSPNGDLAVSIDDSGQVAMWNAETGEIFGVLTEPAAPDHSSIQMKPMVQFLDSGQLVFIYDDGSNDPQIYWWNSVSPRE
jgi:WD40 repeat protein